VILRAPDQDITTKPTTIKLDILFLREGVLQKGEQLFVGRPDQDFPFFNSEGVKGKVVLLSEADQTFPTNHAFPCDRVLSSEKIPLSNLREIVDREMFNR
jgi:hypothetical protein